MENIPKWPETALGAINWKDQRSLLPRSLTDLRDERSRLGDSGHHKWLS